MWRAWRLEPAAGGKPAHRLWARFREGRSRWLEALRCRRPTHRSARRYSISPGHFGACVSAPGSSWAEGASPNQRTLQTVGSCPSAFPRPCCSPASGPGGATRPGSWRWETGRLDPRQPGPTGAARGPDLRPGHRRRASVRRGPEESENGRRSSPCRGAPAARRGRPAWDRGPPPGYNGPAGTPRPAHPGGRSQWPGIGTAIIPARCASARRSAGSTWAGARSPGSRPCSTSNGGPSAWPGRWPGAPRRPDARSPRPTSGSWRGWPT